MNIKTILAILAVGSIITFAACSNQTAKSDAKPATADSTKILAGKYKCPMCTDVVQDSAGKCPKCGMDLVLASDNKQDTTKK